MESCMFLSKLAEIRHESVDGVFHVQMSDRAPNRIILCQLCLLLLLPTDGVLIRVPDLIRTMQQ